MDPALRQYLTSTVSIQLPVSVSDTGTVAWGTPVSGQGRVSRPVRSRSYQARSESQPPSFSVYMEALPAGCTEAALIEALVTVDPYFEARRVSAVNHWMAEDGTVDHWRIDVQ
jgi:hypothetical protein